MSLKGICQAWGLNISKGISGKARLKDLIENHAAFPEELKESLVDMVTHAQTAQKALNKITKTLEELAKSDKVCQLIQTIPGLGSICSCRLRATVGDIKRFKSPKDFPAYYGLVPRSIATGHNERKGKITHRGDRTMRSLMVQAAGSLVNMATKGKLKSKQLTKWILKKQKEKCHGENSYAPLPQSFYGLLELFLSATNHITQNSRGREMLIAQRELKI